jgi:ATP-dependent DNA helicase RecQ
MVATNAFGMGIDKSNVAYVIHYNMPRSIEAYYQEAGRAGRDGENAECILFFSAGDISTAKFLIMNSKENDELSDEERCFVQQQDLLRLNAIIDYCKTKSCLRATIMEYFSQEHQNYCGNCSNCLSELIIQDITPEAKMILSCVKRVSDKFGYSVGVTLIIRVLKGSMEKRVLELGLDGLSTFSLMKTTDRLMIKEYIEHLEYAGYLRTNPNHGGIELTEASSNVLFQNESVLMPIRQYKTSSSKHERKSGAYELSGDSKANKLFEALRALRYDLAKKESIPAYIVFSNASLVDMVKKAPKTMQEFMSVSGVGEVKASRYGKVFINAIVEHDKEVIN